jgi:thiol-disulfide isomerase/thioredoxin
MKRVTPIFLILLFVSACSALPDLTRLADTMNDQTTEMTVSENNGRVVAPLPDHGEAPELTNTIWLNTPNEQPLRLADLRGQVVLLDFWTFGCINCIHVIPSLREWHDKYSDKGLTIIGNHFPEFSYEHDLANVRDAIKRFEIRYSVAQDNDGATWYAYGTRYWPTMILIDKRGHIRYTTIGEGNYERTEKAIQLLLAETYP